MAVSKGTGARSQRRLTARSKLRAIQAILFTKHAVPPSREGCKDGSNVSSVRSLGRYLFCLAEQQELRLSCSEETLADAVGFSLSDSFVDSGGGTPNPSPLVSTWLHDEGHHSDVCELARDVLLSASAAMPCAAPGIIDKLTPLWTSLFSCMVRHGHIKALIHSLSICDHKIFLIFGNPSLNSDIFRILVRVADDAAIRIQQVAELLAARRCTTIHDENIQATDDGGSKVDSASMLSRTHNVLLLSHNCSVGADHWDTPPEDVGLTAQRVARCWTVLGKGAVSFSVGSSLICASAEEKTTHKREFLDRMKETSLHLLAAAQAVGACALDFGAADDLALRDVLSSAAQQCATSSLVVMRNVAEGLHVQFASNHRIQRAIDTSSEDDKWVGVVGFLGEHVVNFLAQSLTFSLNGASQENKCTEALFSTSSYLVLDFVIAEFPSSVVEKFLNRLCGINSQAAGSGTMSAPPVVSKSLTFDDDETPAPDRDANLVAYHFIEEIIRCSANFALSSSALAGGEQRANLQFTQKGKSFTVIFNWMFNRQVPFSAHMFYHCFDFLMSLVVYLHLCNVVSCNSYS